jgi:hypothetical protein
MTSATLQVDRKQLFAELETLRNDPEIRELFKSEDAAIKEWETAKRELGKLERSALDAGLTRSSAVGVRDMKIRPIELELLDSADPLIQETIDDFHEERERILKVPTHFWTEGTGKLDVDTGREIEVRRSNYDSLREVAEKFRLATIDLQALKLKNVDDVESAVRKVAKRLPDFDMVDTHWEVKG